MKDPSYADKGMRCAMQYEDILLYQSLDEHRSVPRSYRLMRVLLESIEDIYLLSMCDALIAQASSHFSTMAAMLMTARLGVSNVLSNVVYLDIENVKSGLFPTALLHGMALFYLHITSFCSIHFDICFRYEFAERYAR